MGVAMRFHYPLLATFDPWLFDKDQLDIPEPTVDVPEPIVEPTITTLQADVASVVENIPEAATGGPETLLDILESEQPKPETPSPKVPPYFTNVVRRGRRNQRDPK